MSNNLNHRQVRRDAKNGRIVRKEAESSGIRFASRDSANMASVWVISKYAHTFKKLAQ
jgi:hypothetical protein